MNLRRALAAAAFVSCAAGASRAEPEAAGLEEAEWQPGSSGVAPADERPPEDRDATALDPTRRALSTAVALGPGALVHGAGHMALGRPETAKRLALTQGVGLGVAVGGIAGLALTGASRYFVAPLALTVIAGGGLFLLPWAADVYGTASFPDGTGSAPLRAPIVVSELGHRYVYDPQFRYRNFLVQGVDLRLDAFRLATRGWFALDDQNARVRLLGAYRLSGPTPHAAASDGSFVDLEAALTHHRFDSDGFRTLTGEVSVNLRRDLARWDAGLSGSFVEGGLGLALQRFEYRIPGMRVDPDVNDLLLARYAFGFYLGRGDDSGEAQIFYDHRHDDYAAGLKLPGLGSGNAGHFGLDARFFWGSWGIGAEAQVGSAWIFGASFVFRQGVQ